MGVMTRTTEQFIELANQAHGNKYDYSKCIYNGSLNKVTVTCLTHGDFCQQANIHRRGAGCPKCTRVNPPKNPLKSFDSFVKKANIVHNNQYDYSKVEYKQRELKVEIICLKGHHFFQTPTKHLLGRGCPTCKNSSGEAQITKILLDMKVKYETQAMFDKCRGPESGRKLKFDFYIPNYNLLIEFDGMQHFQPVSFGADKETAEERFAKQLVRDHTKEEFCKLENIRLLRLDYRDNINTWKQNIEDKMRCI